MAGKAVGIHAPLEEGIKMCYTNCIVLVMNVGKCILSGFVYCSELLTRQ